MSLQKKIISTIVIQAAAPISLFLVVWRLGTALGPSAQAGFSEVKSTVDFAVAMLSFGLPQSFVFAIHKLGISRGRLTEWTVHYALSLMIIGTPLLIILSETGALAQPLVNGKGALALAVGAAGVVGLVVHALLRGIVLTVTDGPLFSITTAFPSVMLAAVALISIQLSRFDAISAYSLVGISSGAIVAAILRKHLKEKRDEKLPWGILATNGGAVFVQNLGATFQPFVTFALMRANNGSDRDAAFFSLALYVYQAGVLPLAMIAPLLFNRWAGATRRADFYRDFRVLITLLVPIVVLSLVAWLAAENAIPMFFDASYSAATPAVQVLILGIPFLYIGQVASASLMSLGYFRVNAYTVLGKIGLFLSVFLLLASSAPAVLFIDAAQAWVVADIATALVLVAVLFIRANRGG